jgi:hypothetical protein
MRRICIELLHYITEAIDNNASDEEIDRRYEYVVNRDDITHEECCQIYEQAILAYKVKFGIL